MDNQQLIQLVYENECLWYVKSENHSNRELVHRAWQNIGKIMGVNANVVKNKWRCLRDTFRKEKRKLEQRRQENKGGVVKEPSLPYYKNMMFIEDQTLPQDRDSDIIPLIEHINVEQHDDTSSFIINNESPRSCRSKKRKRKSTIKLVEMNFENKIDEEIKPIIDVEEPNIDGNRTDNQDADYYFLMSLLPYLRGVDKHRKMKVRMILQQVFCEEENRKNKKSQSSSSEETSD